MKLKDLLDRLGNYWDSEEVMICEDGSSDIHDIEFTTIEHVEDDNGNDGASVVLWVSSRPEARIYEK